VSDMEGHGQIRRPFWTKFPASSTGRVGSATRHEGLVGREQKEVLQCSPMQCSASEGFSFTFFYYFFLSFSLSSNVMIVECCEL